MGAIPGPSDPARIVITQTLDGPAIAVLYPTAAIAIRRIAEAKEMLREATECPGLKPVRAGRLWLALPITLTEDR